MKDFIGNEIQPGDFVAKGGTGNGAAEYGMIAYRVLAIKNDKLSVERLTVHYLAGKSPGVVVLKKTNIANSNAVLVFQPTEKILQLFADAKPGTLSKEDRALVGKWIHGPEHVHPWED